MHGWRELNRLACKNPKEGDATQADSFVAAVAAAKSLACACSLRKQSAYTMENPQRDQQQCLQIEGHPQGQPQGEVEQDQQRTDTEGDQQRQKQRMEVEREEQQCPDTQGHE